jgi:hypothetical protein
LCTHSSSSSSVQGQALSHLLSQTLNNPNILALSPLLAHKTLSSLPPSDPLFTLLHTYVYGQYSDLATLGLEEGLGLEAGSGVTKGLTDVGRDKLRILGMHLVLEGLVSAASGGEGSSSERCNVLPLSSLIGPLHLTAPSSSATEMTDEDGDDDDSIVLRKAQNLLIAATYLNIVNVKINELDGTFKIRGVKQSSADVVVLRPPNPQMYDPTSLSSLNSKLKAYRQTQIPGALTYLKDKIQVEKQRVVTENKVWGGINKSAAAAAAKSGVGKRGGADFEMQYDR